MFVIYSMWTLTNLITVKFSYQKMFYQIEYV